MTDKNKEYELLGYRVKFTSGEFSTVDPSRVVRILLDEVTKIKSEHNVHTHEAVLLSALKFASDKIILEEEMKTNISQLKSSAVDVLNMMESHPPS